MSLRRVWHLCNLQCVSVLFWLISFATYVFKSPSICFWGTRYDVFCERVAYLHSILWRRARLWLELFAFVSFSSEPPWLYFEKAIRLSREIFMFLAAIWSSLCFWRSMYRFIPPLIALVPQDSNVALYTQVCWLFCVLYMPLFGLVSCFMLHFVLWLAYLIDPSKVLKVGGKQKPYQMWQAGISLAGFAREGIWWPARTLTHLASYAG